MSVRIPLNIKSTRRDFVRCKTEEGATKLYERILKYNSDTYTEKEKAMLRALYEHTIYHLKNPTLALMGRNRGKNGAFINDGEEGR